MERWRDPRKRKGGKDGQTDGGTDGQKDGYRRMKR